MKLITLVICRNYSLCI